MACRRGRVPAGEVPAEVAELLGAAGHPYRCRGGMQAFCVQTVAGRPRNEHRTDLRQMLLQPGRHVLILDTSIRQVFTLSTTDPL